MTACAPPDPALAPAPVVARGPAPTRRTPAGPGAGRPGAWAASACTALWLLAGSVPASAHDTWLSLREGAPAQRVWLRLGTGEQYPQMSSPVPATLLRQAACSTGPAAPGGPTQRPLRAQQAADDALWLHGAWPGADGAAPPALSCWAETQPQDTTLTPAEVATYLDEARAPAALRARWAALAAQGLPWRERFSKHTRLELVPASRTANPVTTPTGPATTTPTATEATTIALPPAAATATAMPLAPSLHGRSPLPVELVAEPPAPGPRPAALTLRLWRDGAPLPDHPVQLLGDELPRGLWLRTDAEGRLRLSTLPGGTWLLRGVDLQPPAQDDGPWRSRFFSLRFQPGA